MGAHTVVRAVAKCLVRCLWSQRIKLICVFVQIFIAIGRCLNGHYCIAFGYVAASYFGVFHHQSRADLNWSHPSNGLFEGLFPQAILPDLLQLLGIGQQSVDYCSQCIARFVDASANGDFDVGEYLRFCDGFFCIDHNRQSRVVRVAL